MKKGLDSIVEQIDREDYISSWMPRTVSDAKVEAVDFLKKNGFPDHRDEEYKKTPVKRVLEACLSSKKDILASSGNEKLPTYDLIIPSFAEVSFFNSQVVIQQSDDTVTKQMIVIKKFSECTEEEMKPFIFSLSKKGDAFAKLNDGLFQDGLFIKIPQNVKIDKPLILNYLSLDKMENPRVFVHAEKGAEALIIEAFEGRDGTVTNHTIEILVEENAQVEYNKVQCKLNGNVHVGNAFVHQKSNSRFTASTFALDGKLVRNNLSIEVDGSGAESNMYGIYLPHNQSHIDNHTVVDDIQPHCNSNQLYKGIVKDKGMGVFNGKIFVRQAAQKTAAFQSNKSVVLSDEGKMHAKPELEIFADDVNCSHGCTSGRLDENALFYLRARGISKEESQKLLLQAFVTDAMDGVSLDELKTYLVKYMYKYIEA